MRHPITRDQYEAVLFDMDGVVTDTVSIHAACWKTMFDEFLRKWAMRNAQRLRSFDLVTDYEVHVDGKRPKRGEGMTAGGAGFYLDYSKNRITAETLKLLLKLADESGLRQRIDSMFSARRSILRKTARYCTSRCAQLDN
jgi:beta-phosphoglucomutase-like phosphatase (HAD superfamily)